MTWQYCTIENTQQFSAVYSAVVDMLSTGKKVELQLREKQTKRKDAQNALQFHWFKEMEMQGDKSASEYRSQCKLELGVPIAREDEGYRQKYDSMLRSLPYQTKVALMGEPFNMEVTRNFTVKDMTRYLQEVEQFGAKCGMRLTTSEDLYYQAMGLTR